MKKGFTLLELMVTIGILAILLGISVGGFALLKRRGDLNIAALQVKDFILQAKTEATAGRDLTRVYSDVHFSSSKVTLCGRGAGDSCPSCLTDKTINTLNLSNVSPTITITAGTNRILRFRSPNGESEILTTNSNCPPPTPSENNLIITLTDSSTNKKIDITFNKISGRVDVGTPY